MTAVTETSHRAVFKALRNVEYDNGMINRLEPARKQYDIPFSHKHTLPDVEEYLAGLSESDLEEFCIGGDDGRGLVLGASSPVGVMADDFLNAFFEDWS